MPLDLPGRQDVVEIEGPVEVLISTFLQDILSDRMEMGKEYDLRVQEIVHDLEESGVERGLGGSPSKSVKEELIRREETYRDSRKGGDGKMSSESAEETEKITIEDSRDGDSFMIRTVGLQGCSENIDQPEPLGDVSTPPINESTPSDGRIMRKEEGKARPQYVAKNKLWVEPERTIEEGRDTSSDGESGTSRPSTMSKRYVERRAVGDATRDGAPNYAQQRPRGFGARHTHVRVKQDPDTGLHVVSAVNDDDEGLVTGAERDGVWVVSARSWLGDGEVVRGGNLAVGGELDDLDEHLIQIILGISPPRTVPCVLQHAVISFPDRAPWYLRSVISIVLLTMRKTTQHILMQSIRKAPAVNPLTAMTVPLEMDTVAQYLSASN